MSTGASLMSKAARSPEVRSEDGALIQRHLRVGWWALLLFLTLGLGLEALHGFKVGFYLKVSNETRRLMWTLAHAHGTLFGLLNLGFALTVRLLPDWAGRDRGLASICLRVATVLMPAGFFFGGVWVHGGDPGLAILLVPVGGVLLFVAVWVTARGCRLLRSNLPDEKKQPSAKPRRE
jgi:hypothetical protein